MTVPVWYASDRKRTGSAAPRDWYSGDRGTLTYGRADVSIPDTHDTGKLEKPRLFRLEFREDPEKHIVLLSVAERDAAAWRAEIKQGLDSCPARDILLFIHGYNVDFERAAQRAAQFAYDLEFQGACVLYSWPSEGATLKYFVDEDNALWTVDHFETVLTTVMTELGAARVHAVAHSMGSRVLAEGLRRVDVSAFPAGSAALREVVFAAPDINADTFRNFITKFYARAGRFTLYASNGDKALESSQALQQVPARRRCQRRHRRRIWPRNHRCVRRGHGPDGPLLLLREPLRHPGSLRPDHEGRRERDAAYRLTARSTPDGTYWVMGR